MKAISLLFPMVFLLVMVITFGCAANEYNEFHVSIEGDDQNKGSASKPYRTISAAAAVAEPGDIIIIHGGTYRERIDPPRGGASDHQRIIYRAAEGEEVIIKGSEVVEGWEKVQNDTWKTIIDNRFFGDFNPYSDLIRGDWFNPKGRDHHTGAVYQNGHWLVEAVKLEEVLKPIGLAEGMPEMADQQHQLWFAEVDSANTTIWAQFKDVDPNEGLVEINVRQAVFYPEKPGVNFITVRGLKMKHAATPWAPPTAEQIGLIGTHWSKGWIIEDNDISYSVCTGITLGKHGDEFDNTSANSAEGYVETIERALKRGWSKENIGHHIVRNNHISHCEQAGIVGSMGPIFSTITENTIHDIHIRRLFTGAEMAGIKFHGAIDTVINHNHIFRANRGIWLDWMTQGTRVTGNLLHDNGPNEDLFVEVNHGPFLVDNNVFLSGISLLEASGGGAYAHNLFSGQIRLRPEVTRDTPFQRPHSTEVLGLSKVVGDDERFHNNLFVGHAGLSVYSEKDENLQSVGNVYLSGAQPSRHDREATVVAGINPNIMLDEKPDGLWLEISLDPAFESRQKRSVVTTESLGRAIISGVPFVKPDGTPYRVDTDYFGNMRNTENPAPGPFLFSSEKGIRLKVWPKKQPIDYRELSAGFQNPGRQARPRAYWNWLNGAVTLEGLTRDLEEAKDKGLIGLEMWDTEAMRNPSGFVPAGPPFMGPESVAFMHHAMREAKRLGLDLGLITSSGWNAGGPWIPPELASKNLFFKSVTINGPGQITQKLPFPEVPRLCPKGEDGLPKWHLDVAVLAWPDSKDNAIDDPSKVIDITDRFNNGELTWSAPAGRWQVVRYVCSNNGQQLIAASPNSKGPFIDFLDPEATRFHFEYIIDRLGLTKGGDPDSPLKYLEVDSMELHEGIQWTPKFPEWFKKSHGYDPVAWLPVLTGWTVKDKATSERFQYDYKKTVSDLLIFSHYTTGSEVCAEYGLELAGEAGGPGPPIWDSCPVDALKALGSVSIPRGEFWLKNQNNIFLVKEIASAAHIYGKPYVDAESWTTWRRWKDSPFVRKQIVDRAFCEGLNRITYHGYSHSPKEAGLPGRSYHAGVDMNPQVVWWSKARPFMDYLARCCFMLQQGLFVADVAYYYGDQAPNFWPAFMNVPEKPLLDGLGAGFDYDVVNSDVIVNRMSVKDGRIVFPDGMSYRVLVLPDKRDMQLDVLVKLETLVSNGATIIGPKPLDVPGLQDHESRGVELRALADKMWGACDGVAVKQNSYGKGKVIWGVTPGQWLALESIGPDFSCQTTEYETQLDYIHRQTTDTDIYFVRNTSLLPVIADCLFRVKNRTPQLWDPADGSMEPMFVYKTVNGGTRVWLDLPPGGSVFVVFDTNQAQGSINSVICTSETNDSSLPAWRIKDFDKTSITIQCWQNGHYTLWDNSGQKKQVQVDTLPEPLTLTGQWQVTFDPNWGAPAEIMLPKLISWTDHENQGIEYYSGAGFYSKTIYIPSDWLISGRRVHLDLGDVRELAEVFVNGKSAGVLWKPPFRADITSLVKPGANKLKIEVMNMWINRLAGDQNLPAEKKFTRTNITFDGYRGKPGMWQVQPAGLLGPVRLLPSVNVSVNIDGR